MVASNETTPQHNKGTPKVPSPDYTLKSDMYINHKVVAMPSSSSSLTSRVRDSVASRDTIGGRRMRSHSAGRAAPSGRDIVQDVYDRMGVNYKRGESLPLTTDGPPSARGRDATPRGPEDLQQRYKAAAELSTVRSRSLERRSEGQRRARSLSRGRSAVAGRWPPPKNGDTEAESLTTTTPMSPVRPAYTVATAEPQQTLSPVRPASTTSSSSVHHSPKNAYSSSSLKPTTTDSRSTSTFNSSLQTNTSAWKKRGSELSPLVIGQGTTPSASWTSEGNRSSPAEEPTPEDAPTAATTPSIKDRISVFAGASNKKKTGGRKFPQRVPLQYRDHPPKIDIFASPQEPGHPSPVAATAASAAQAELVRSRNAPSGTVDGSRSVVTEQPPWKTTSSSSRSIETTKSKQTTSAPVSERAAALTESSRRVESTTSSLGGDDVSTSPRYASHDGSFPSSATSKRSSWSKQQSKATETTSSLTMAQVEELVEARVQQRVAELESKMEQELRRVETRAEQKIEQLHGMINLLVESLNDDKHLEI